MVVTELRQACALVAQRARQVEIHREQIPLYAASLPTPPALRQRRLPQAQRAPVAWYWLTLNAINFGSGWFPTLRKRPGRTGYSTIASALQTRFDAAGAWTAAELSELRPRTVAAIFDQDDDHPLMAHFAASLNDLGAHLRSGYGGDPLALIDAAEGSAVALVETLATWSCFRDVSRYDELQLPFLKRAQIAAADLHRAGAARWNDLTGLTMFADNLVPHVLRLDGVLDFAPQLVTRIANEQLIEHGSPEEVEIRACAVTAVELIVDAWPPGPAPTPTAAQIDQLLWLRGQERRYKAEPRHRSRSTAY